MSRSTNDLFGEVLLEPILGEVLDLARLQTPGEPRLALQRQLGAGVHDLQLHLAVARRVEDEAHGEGDAPVRMLHFVAGNTTVFNGWKQTL